MDTVVLQEPDQHVRERVLAGQHIRGTTRENHYIEEVYLHAYVVVGTAQQGLERYLTFYNLQRQNRVLDGKTPDQVLAIT